MRVLITGGAGFIGHHISNDLVKKGYYVEVWDNLITGNKDRLDKLINFKVIDILYDELPSIYFDIVIHLASPTSVEESINNDIKYKEGCYLMTKKIYEWSLNNNIKRFIFSSTSAVYGNPLVIPTSEYNEVKPLSPYAKYKLMSEEFLMSDNLINTTILRFFNVFGEGQSNRGLYAPAIAKFIEQKNNGHNLTVTGNGEQTRDFIYVKDISKTIIEIIEKSNKKIELYNLGTGRETKIIDIAKSLSNNISFIEERDEPKRSCSNIDKIKKEYVKDEFINILEWIKNKK